MKSKLRVMFDLDGVLLESEEDLTWLERALSKTLRVFGIEDTEENLKKLYPGKLRNFREEVKDLSVGPKELWRKRNANYIEEKVRAMKKGEIKPYPDVSALYQLKDPFLLGIITNSPQEVVDAFVEEFQYEDLFVAWIGRGSRLPDLQKIKPNPYLFKRIREEVGNGQFVYVGDREVDQEFAENTGMEFLPLTRNRNSFKNLEEIVKYLKSS